MSEMAIEQRLRRYTATRKSGVVASGVEMQGMFKDLEQRQQLLEWFKESMLNKAGQVNCT